MHDARIMRDGTSEEGLRAAQVRAASTAFLRVRPLVVFFTALAQALVVARAPLPGAQRAWLVGLLGSAVLLFTFESLVLARRQVTERWLWISLALTELGLGLAASASGGLGAPITTLLLAPLVVALSALHQRALPLGVLLLAVLGALALAPPLGPPLPAEVLPASHAITLVATAVLCTLGVVQLGGAHHRATRALGVLQQSAIDEAAARGREAEALGARVAHELKNPLAAISALVALGARDATGRDAERLAVVTSELARMDHIVRDYLTLARPLTDVHVEEVSVSAVLSGVAELIEGRATRSGVRVILGLERASDWTVRADPRRLREALLNLAANAIEAMPGGGVLTLGAERDDGGTRLVVADDGEGIDELHRARVGEAFFSRREGGTGLGLAHARSVARLHGGTLSLEHPARGVRAILSLPVDALAAPGPVG